jgi:hypothetical protein
VILLTSELAPLYGSALRCKLALNKWRVVLRFCSFRTPPLFLRDRRDKNILSQHSRSLDSKMLIYFWITRRVALLSSVNERRALSGPVFLLRTLRINRL